MLLQLRSVEGSKKPLCSLFQAFAYWAGAMEDMAMIYIPINVQEFVKKFICENYNGVEGHLTKQWAFNVTSMFDLQISFILLCAL